MNRDFKKMNMEKSIALSVRSEENLKTLQNQIFFIKHEFFLLFVISVAVKIKTYLKRRFN